MKTIYSDKVKLMLNLTLFFQVKAPDYIQHDEGKAYVLPMKRRANNCKEDFDEIFEREFSKSGLRKREDKEYFKEVLIEDIQYKINSYKEETKDKAKDGRAHGLILLVNQFIVYLKESLKPEIKVISENESKLTIKQIALKLFYEGTQVTRVNAGEIIKRFGHGSGEKLFQEYTFYSSNANRKSIPCTCVKLKNKIELFEKVSQVVDNEFKSKVLAELELLKKHYNDEYQ